MGRWRAGLVALLGEYAWRIALELPRLPLLVSYVTPRFLILVY